MIKGEQPYFKQDGKDCIKFFEKFFVLGESFFDFLYLYK